MQAIPLVFIKYVTITEDSGLVSAPKKEDEFVLQTAEDEGNSGTREISSFFVKGPGLAVGIEASQIVEVFVISLSSKEEELVLMLDEDEMSFIFWFQSLLVVSPSLEFFGDEVGGAEGLNKGLGTMVLWLVGRRVKMEFLRRANDNGLKLI